MTAALACVSILMILLGLVTPGARHFLLYFALQAVSLLISGFGTLVIGLHVLLLPFLLVLFVGQSFGRAGVAVFLSIAAAFSARMIHEIRKQRALKLFDYWVSGFAGILGAAWLSVTAFAGAMIGLVVSMVLLQAFAQVTGSDPHLIRILSLVGPITGACVLGYWANFRKRTSHTSKLPIQGQA